MGGTRFVGRHLVDAALSRGDRVTLFNRGQSAAPQVPVPAGLTLLRGDRQGDMSGLAEGQWDAVIDTCAYLPADADRMARQLARRVGRYALISSVSAYASAALPNPEDAALGQIDDCDTTVVDGRTYGPLKALCEAAVVKHMGPARSLLIRPGPAWCWVRLIRPSALPGGRPGWRGQRRTVCRCWRLAMRNGRCSSSTPATWRPLCCRRWMQAPAAPSMR